MESLGLESVNRGIVEDTETRIVLIQWCDVKECALHIIMCVYVCLPPLPVSEGDGAKVPIQVESGGNEDMDDFYLSHRSYRTSHSSIPSVVHGRTPIMKHTQNEEGEGKGQSQFSPQM